MTSKYTSYPIIFYSHSRITSQIQISKEMWIHYNLRPVYSLLKCLNSSQSATFLYPCGIFKQFASNLYLWKFYAYSLSKFSSKGFSTTFTSRKRWNPLAIFYLFKEFNFWFYSQVNGNLMNEMDFNHGAFNKKHIPLHICHFLD